MIDMITDAHREVADVLFRKPSVVRMSRKRMECVPLLCEMYADWKQRNEAISDPVAPQMTVDDVVGFSDDRWVWRGGRAVGLITQRASGLWMFWRWEDDDTVTPWPQFYPTYFIAEVSVRALLENPDEPEIGQRHDG